MADKKLTKKILDLDTVIEDIRGIVMTNQDEDDPGKTKDLSMLDVILSSCGIFAAAVDPNKPEAAMGENIRAVGLGEKCWDLKDNKPKGKRKLEVVEGEIVFLKKLIALHRGFIGVVKVKACRILDNLKEIEYKEIPVEQKKGKGKEK